MKLSLNLCLSYSYFQKSLTGKTRAVLQELFISISIELKLRDHSQLTSTADGGWGPEAILAKVDQNILMERE